MRAFTKTTLHQVQGCVYPFKETVPLTESTPAALKSLCSELLDPMRVGCNRKDRSKRPPQDTGIRFMRNILGAQAEISITESCPTSDLGL